MIALSHAGLRRSLHPLHAILLAFPLSLFVGALLSDIAYWATYHEQWANFSAWLIAGGVLGATFVVVWALVDLFRGSAASRGRRAVFFIVVLAMWGLGFANALVHAKDAWATMPEGLYLSVVTSLLGLVAGWIGYSGFQSGEVS